MIIHRKYKYERDVEADVCPVWSFFVPRPNSVVPPSKFPHFFLRSLRNKYILPSKLTMLLPRALPRRTGLVRLPGVRQITPRRTIIPAPGPNTGPLMERRADRELPTINTSKGWLKTLPIFVVAVGAAMLGIFNYQKSSSSVVSSTLYALRTSPQAREILGDEIYFAQQIPWISGEMNQLHGRINISFWVKGTKGQGKMRFKSVRPDRMSFVSDPERNSYSGIAIYPLRIQTVHFPSL